MDANETEATGLIDITHFPLSALRALDDSTALGRSLRRVAEVDKSEEEATSAFNSAV